MSAFETREGSFLACGRRTARNDGLTLLAVQWRDPRGRPQSEALREADAAAAAEFRRLVEACGNEWPPPWVKGEGFPEDPS